MKALFWENRMAKVLALKAASWLHPLAALGPLSPLRYAGVPEPELPGPRWMKVRNIACGLCGTDLHFMFMDLHPKSFNAAMPGIARKFLGHELVAEVIETGAEVFDVQVGERVAMRIDWPSCFQLEIDPPCPQCAAGNYMLCENVGKQDPAILNRGGGFSPFMVMHRTQPFTVPESMDNDSAVLLEPMASAVHGVCKAPPEPGDTVLVLGAGTLGLLTVAVLRTMHPDARVCCLARYPFQAAVAEQLGATVIPEGARLYERVADASGARYVRGTLGNEILLGGFGVVYDTVGNGATVNNALRWTRGGGAVVLMGIHFHPARIDYSPVWSQEVRLLGINCHATEADGRNSFEVAADLLTRGAVPPDAIITHRFPVRDYRDAVKTFLSKDTSHAIKIVLDVNGG